MDQKEFLAKLDALVAEKHLLKHPFYVLWTQGKLTRENLREYAISYYPHVADFPTLRLRRPLGLRGRGAAAGAPREPDRRGARRRRTTRPSGAVSRPRSAPPRRISRALPARPRSRPPIAEFRRDPLGLGGRGARGALRLRIADPGGLEDQARGAGVVLRHRRCGRDAVLLGPRGGRRVAPAGRARGARARRRHAGDRERRARGRAAAAATP